MFAVTTETTTPGTAPQEANPTPPGAEETTTTTLGETTVPPEAPESIKVPNLVNGTVDEARATLAEVGLVLGNDPDGDSAVESQAPTAGTLVPAGSTVTVTVNPATVPTSERTPVWPVAAVLILLGAALLVPRAFPVQRRPKWVRAHVRTVAGGGPGRHVEITPLPPDRSLPTCVVRIEPRADPGRQVLEEVDQ
jgi:hypothetical protein